MPQCATTPALRSPSVLAPLLTRAHLPLNLCTLVAATYSTLYLYLSPNLAGLTISPIILGLASASNFALAGATSTSSSARTKLLGIAGVVHVAAWIAQFVGHGKYEGRKPALVDNVVQAVFEAPLFVWYETLFRWGFYKGLHKDVNEGIEVELAKVREREAEKKGKGTVEGIVEGVDTDLA